MKDFKTILIIQTAFIGDVILSTVLIEQLKKHYPEAKIDFLLRKGNESLLQGHPHLREVLIWNKKKQKQKNLLKILKRIRKARYDVLINLQRFTSSGILTALSGAKLKIGYDKNPLSFFFNKKVKHQIGDGTHEVVRNLSLIQDLTDGEMLRPRLYPSEADYDTVRSYQDMPYICMAPASVWFTKQWAKEKWIELLDHLDQNYRVYLLGSPADQSFAEGIAQGSQHQNVVNLAGKLSLLASAALMQKAKMNYVNDSAPMHLASAVNAPTCAIFCSTVPSFGFGPLADQSSVVEISEKLSCRPCGLHGQKACPEGHFKCAKGIQVTQLLDVFNQSMGQIDR